MYKFPKFSGFFASIVIFASVAIISHPMDYSGQIFHLTTVHNRYDNRILLKECATLAEYGYDVYILVADNIPDEVYDGVNILGAGEKKNKVFSPGIYRDFYGLIKSFRPAVVHFHDLELVPLMLFVKLRMRGVTVVYDVHENNVTLIDHKELKASTVVTSLFRVLKPVTKLVVKGLEKAASRLFNIVIAERYYAERFPGAVPVLNYPKMRSLSSDKNAGGKRLVYTGNVTLSRGCLEMANIVNLVDDVSVHFIGKCKSETYEMIMEKAGENRSRVFVEGVDRFVPFSLIEKRYREGWLAGLALFPFSDHYFKKELTKFFEYMLAGLPVICSDFKAWRDVVEKEGCGICVDPQNEKQVGEAVSFLLENPSEAFELGRRGKRAVWERYNWHIEERKLLGLYDSIID